MKIDLIRADDRHLGTMKNMMQFYIYDFSEYLDYDIEENGLFSAYPDLGDYRKEKNDKFPYIIKKDEKYIGFVLVKRIVPKENHFSVIEFFIMKKYRREGNGKAAAEHVFNLHKGKWEVRQRESNKPALEFWNKVIDQFTGGQFSQRFEDGRVIQNFRS